MTGQATPANGYHYKIQYQWKGPKEKPQIIDFYAPHLKALLDIINKAEGISFATTDLLIIHQIPTTGGHPTEVVSHDTSTNVIALRNDEGRTERVGNMEARRRSLSRRRVDAHVRANASWWEKMLKGGSTSVDDEEETLTAVEDAIKKANTPSAEKKEKPRIRLQHVGDPYVIGGFFYKAYEARGTERKPLVIESNKHGVLECPSP